MIIATAGHVDHGKTSLIKELTGIDTDRLEEEKRRGLSINLGFAYRKTENATLGFIDVPGHKRFINTMISGLSGIDMALLIIAADDGPMPQTIEHLDILLLLDIKKITIVISKIDKVDSKRLQAVQKNALSLLPDKMVSETKIFPLSSTSGKGIEALKAYLDEAAIQHPSDTPQGLFRQNIDRVFNLKGSGLVITGTVKAGQIKTGDAVKLIPKGSTVKVRGIHANDQAAEMAMSGQRCALNLSGDIHKKDIHKGDWLLAPEAAQSSDCFSASFSLLASSPITLKHMSPVKLYIGARHLSARISFLEKQEANKYMQAGDERLVRFLLDEPVCCFCKERFLIRDDSESFLLGGGIILDPFASRKRKITADYLNYLKGMSAPDFVSSFNTLLFKKQRTIDFKHFRLSWNLAEAEAQSLLDAATLPDTYQVLKGDKANYCLSEKLFSQFKKEVISTVQNWHDSNPHEQGIKLEKLVTQLQSKIERAVCICLLTALINDGQLSLSNGILKQKGFSPKISSDEQKDWQIIARALSDRGKQIPSIAELVEITQIDKNKLNAVLNAAVKNGNLKRINNKRFALNKTLLDFSTEVNTLTKQQSKFTAVDFKNQAGIGRNLAIELLEYFDAIRFTQRQGNERIILNSNIASQLFNS